MHCQYCGHEVNEEAKICLSCGCPTDNYQTTVPTATATPVAMVPATGLPEYSPKKGVVTLILLFLLGLFGGHRFYVGRIGSAIGMLTLSLLFYIFNIWRYFKEALNKHNPDYAISTESIIDQSVSSLVLLAMVIWCIVDLVSLCSGKFQDGNGRVIKLS